MPDDKKNAPRDASRIEIPVVSQDNGQWGSDAVAELLRALEGGAAVARVNQRFIPLIERDPVRFWQAVCAILALALLAALAWPGR